MAQGTIQAVFRCRCGIPTHSGLCGTCRAAEEFEAERAARVAMKAATDRAAAVRWAREVLSDPDAVFLDTETTGLIGPRKPPVFTVDLAVLDATGVPLVDTLVNPLVLIPVAASDIHHITNDMVSGAPTFAEVLPELEAALAGRRVVIFNAAYDTAVIECELTRHHRLADAERGELGEWWWSLGARVECAMLACGDFEADWCEYRQDWRWPKLDNDAPDAHRAMSDCRATLARLRHMVGADIPAAASV